ncbi:hypothetical protein B0H13DRAFT_1899745 [Mycena leptocephala]|nr:hypothetical protein B0H13DRAFT_1899745 [Mycena leptocephala]
MEVPTGPLLLNWNALFRHPRCPVTSAQVVIPSRVYPVPHTSSAPSEVAVPPMHPTLDRLKALANSLSSYPPSSLSHNSDPMLSRASLGLGLGMHTASLGTHTASVPYIPTSVSSSTSVSYPASALYNSSLVFTPDHNQNAFTTPLQGPSLSRRISGPVFPLAPSLGLNGLFLSSNPLENVLVGDIYCLHAHLAIHGLSPQGFGVSFTVWHVKVLSSALGIVSPSTMSELFRVLSEKRVALLHSQSVSHPLHSVFDRVELLPKPALISLAALHGINLKSSKLSEGRDILGVHLTGGSCGLHRSGYRHLGCASLLALSDAHNTDMQNILAMDLGTAIALDLELTQINILASVIKTLSKRPLRRVLQMHKVEFSSSDGTAALRKHLRSYLKRLRRGKKLDFVHMRKTRWEQELSVLRSDWPTMVPIAKRRKIVQDFQSSLSADTLATFVCGSCSARTLVKDQKRLRIKDFDLSLLRRPDYDAQESNDLDDMESDAGMDIDDARGAIAMDVDLVDNTEGDNQTSAVLPAVPLSWLDPECVQPPLPYDDPMPFDSDGNFEGILFDPDGIGSDDDGDTVLLTCRTCSSSLKRGKVPRLSIANYNYLVEVETDCLDVDDLSDLA